MIFHLNVYVAMFYLHVPVVVSYGMKAHGIVSHVPSALYCLEPQPTMNSMNTIMNRYVIRTMARKLATIFSLVVSMINASVLCVVVVYVHAVLHLFSLFAKRFDVCCVRLLSAM